MTTDNLEICVGCAAIDICGQKFGVYFDIDNCPCSLCLVKMRCTTDVCEDYNEFAKSQRLNYRHLGMPKSTKGFVDD